MVTTNDVEEEQVGILTSMMGDLDAEAVRRVLRKCGGDVQKAATAILEGDRGEPPDNTWAPALDQLPMQPETPPASQIQLSRQASQSGVIDLTSDGDDFSRALKASLERGELTFGPTDRAPNPNWAVVPSNVETTTAMSQDEQTLSRAIEESLTSSYNDQVTEVYEPWPNERKVREGSRPVALRPTLSTVTYAALLLQGLFFIPQVRESIAKWRVSAPVGMKEIDVTENSPDASMLCLLELFVNMDLAQLAELSIDTVLEKYTAPPWISAVENPGELTFRFLSGVIQHVESFLKRQYEESGSYAPATRLFNFRHGFFDAYMASENSTAESCIVQIDTGGDASSPNDLISRLSSNLLRSSDNSEHQVIFEPSEVVIFQLRPHASHPSSSFSSGAATGPKSFQYPKSIYMDQFLVENIEIVQRERKDQRQAIADIQRLNARINSITRFNDKDTLKDLRTSLYYFEEVADAKDDSQRQATIKNTATKLRNILSALENEVAELKKQISEREDWAGKLFESPALKKYRYDLRVVLMHDGLYGRNHLYSYIHYKDTWWKSSDSMVVEVMA